MDKKSQVRFIIVVFSLIGILLISFVLYNNQYGDEEQQPTISRTSTTDTSCISVPEEREIILENQCLDWDERNWTEINCNQYNRKPTNNCNIYNNYIEETDCERHNIIGNRTNSSNLGDTPRSIMNCIKDGNSVWDGFECQDVCEADSYCELTPSNNLSETDFVCIDNGYFDNYESNCNNLDGCSWDDNVCEFDVYDYSQDESDCLSSNCGWENNQCFDDEENSTYCAGGYGQVIRNEIINNQQCTATLYSGLMNYDNGTEFVPIDGNIVSSDNPLFDYEVETGEYFAYFKDNPTEGQVVKVVKNTTEITFQPMALNYRNDLSQIEQISMIQSVTGSPTENQFKYENAYGNGLDLVYNYYHESLKEELIINQSTNIPTPAQYILDGGNVTLDLDFILEYDYKIFIDNEEWDKSSDKITSNEVLIKDSEDNIIYKFPKPYAYDSNNSQQLLKYFFKKQGNSLYIIIKTPYSWLQNAVYPIKIDPTITLQTADAENLEDTWIRAFFPDNNDGGDETINFDATAGLGNSYGLYKFDISSILEADLTMNNATLEVYYIGVESPENATIGIFEYDNQTWVEDSMTWNNFTSGNKGDNLVNHSRNSSGSIGFESWNVTSWVLEEYFNNNDNVSFLSQVLDYEGVAGFTNHFKHKTKEDATTSDRPKLTIDYTYTSANITGCTTLDQENATYYLTQDITDSTTSNCMDITANNVVLDCQGHTIDGDNNADHGIMMDSVNNITVKNCTLTDWDTRTVYMIGTSDEISLQNLNVSSNMDYGIYSSGVDNLEVLNTIANENKRGFYISLSSYPTLRNITALNNTEYDVFYTGTSDGQCSAIFDNVTGTDNKPIVFYNYTVNLQNWNNNVSEIILCKADNSILNNITLSHLNLENNGLIMEECVNVTVKNSNFTGLYTGIKLGHDSDKNIFINITSNSNTEDGIGLSNSDLNNFTNIITNLNGASGIEVSYSGSNIFTNITANSNEEQGIYLLGFGDLNIFTNSTISNNLDDGILIINQADNNNFSYNVLQNNSGMGINIDYYSSKVSNNSFYNNLLNNTDNVGVDIRILGDGNNTWNTTKQIGTRIYSNGEKIGGNYYTNSTGTGYSDTCTDTDYDGFCDTEYTNEGNGIDYLPLSDEYAGFQVDQPTSGQIFTQDEPTAIFNITSHEDMDDCVYSFDSGVNNYSMTNATNSTYWSDINTTMVDGASTSNFWCNASDDGEWFEYPVGITFDVDSVNVTVCRDLRVSRTYELLNNLNYSGNDGCIEIENSNLTFDGSGYEINSSGGFSPYVIYMYVTTFHENITIKNLNMYVDGATDGRAIQIGYEYVTNVNILNNNITSYDDKEAVYIYANANVIFVNISNNKIVNNLGGGLYLSNKAENSIIHNNNITSEDTCITLDFSDNTNISDTICDTSSYTMDLDRSENINLINVTYLDNKTETFYGVASLTRKWYFSPQVNYTHNGTAVYDANITAYNSSGQIQETEQTDTNGQTSRWELIEYVNTGGTKSYYTNYTFNVTKGNWDNVSQEINLTTNYINQQFNLSDTTDPVSTITMTSPPDGAGYTNDTWTTNNIKSTITGFDSLGFDNLDYPKYCLDTVNTCNPDTYIGAGVTVSTEGTSYIRYNTTDYQGNSETINSRTLKIDTIAPNISISTPTNNTNSSDDSLDVNYTTLEGSGSGIDACWYSNDTYSTNITLASCTNITIVNWSEGYHNVTIWVNDSVNNTNSSFVAFTIDTTFPEITITNPTNNSNLSSTNFYLNYTFVETTPGSCWYSNDSGVANSSTISMGTNFTLTGAEGNNNRTIYCNDSVNNVNSSIVYFAIDTIFPDINITFPTNNTNSSDNLTDINFTRSDTNLESCWYSNDTYTTNITLASCTNVTTVNWSDGQHNVTIWTNDSSNNINSSFVRFTIDTTPPSLSIIHPTDLTTYSTANISLNFSASDSGLGLDTCWYKNGTGEENNTIDCSVNWTIIQTDGTHQIFMWANDTLNNIAKDNHTYTISTAAPAITLINPSNNTFSNISTIWFNYTAVDVGGVDTCRLYGNWSGGWHINLTNIHGGDTSVDVNEGNFTQDLIDGEYYWNVWCNDTGNTADFYVNNRTLTIDTIFPLIDFEVETTANDTNTTNTFIYANVSTTENREDTITFTLHDQGGEYNVTSYTDGRNEINWTSVPDGNYTYNVTINDTTGNSNTTETRIIRLDDTAPSITILNPLSQNYGTNNSMSLNHTTTDNSIGLDECWYYIQNSSGYTTKATETLSSCENDTFTLPGGDIDYTLYLFANDILNNIASTSITFGIRTDSPVIVLSPINDTHTKTTTDNYFNFTVDTDANSISACDLWGNWSGGWHNNQTINNPTESIETNFSALTIPEGEYFWNVNCTDDFGYTGFGLNNNTFVVDLTLPEINITDITTFAGLQTFDFNTTATDRYNISCKYSIYDNSFLIDGLNENVSFSCGIETSPTVTTFASYTLKTYVEDQAGNENSTNQSFTVSPSVTQLGGGGITIVRGVSALEAINFTITTTNLKSRMDAILAKDSEKPREKQFMLSNDGREEIELEIICDTQNVNESSQDIDICNYIYFEEKNFLVSPNLEDRPIGNFKVLTPPESKIGDEYFFNLLAIRTVGNEQRFSKLSVRIRVTTLAYLIKWSKIPGTKQPTIIGQGQVDGSIYPIAPIAILISFMISAVIFLVLRKFKIPLTGFFIGMGSFIAIFALLIFIL